MIGHFIRFFFTNLPAILLVAALFSAAIGRRKPVAERFLAWVLLLPVGMTGIWAGLFHIAFPGVASRDIGWQPSPFEFEVGVANLAIGVAAFLAFWRSLAFKAAAVWAASIFLLGDAVGHLHQMLAARNFAPGNAGVPFYTDIICPVVAVIFLVLAYRDAQQRLA